MSWTWWVTARWHEDIWCGCVYRDIAASGRAGWPTALVSSLSGSARVLIKQTVSFKQGFIEPLLLAATDLGLWLRLRFWLRFRSGSGSGCSSGACAAEKERIAKAKRKKAAGPGGLLGGGKEEEKSEKGVKCFHCNQMGQSFSA